MTACDSSSNALLAFAIITFVAQLATIVVAVLKQFIPLLKLPPLNLGTKIFRICHAATYILLAVMYLILLIAPGKCNDDDDDAAKVFWGFIILLILSIGAAVLSLLVALLDIAPVKLAYLCTLVVQWFFMILSGFLVTFGFEKYPMDFSVKCSEKHSQTWCNNYQWNNYRFVLGVVPAAFNTFDLVAALATYFDLDFKFD